MTRILNKIIDIVNDIQSGWLDEDTAWDFFRGYLNAQQELGMIDDFEYRDYSTFFNKLIHDRVFLAKECD